MPTQC